MDKHGTNQQPKVTTDPRSVLTREWILSPGQQEVDYFSSDTSPGSFTMVSTPTHEHYELDPSDEVSIMDETSFANLENPNDDLPIVSEVLGTPLEVPTNIPTNLSVDQIAEQIFNSVRGELKRFGETKAIEIAFEKFEIEGVNSTELIQAFARSVADANFKILIDGKGKLFVCRRKFAQQLAEKYGLTVLDDVQKQLSEKKETDEEPPLKMRQISPEEAQKLAEQVKAEKEVSKWDRFKVWASGMPKTIVDNIPLFGALHKKAELMERYGEYEERTSTLGKIGDFFNLYSSSQFQWNGEVSVVCEGEGEIRSVSNLEFSNLESEEERKEVFNRHGIKFSLSSAFHYSNLIDTLGGGVELALTVGAMLGGLTQVATNLGKAGAAVEYLNEGLKTVRTLNWVRYPVARIAQSISDRVLGERNSKEVLTSLALSIPAVLFTLVPGRFLSEGTGILSGELFRKLGLPPMPANMTDRSIAIATRWYLTQLFYAAERKYILPILASLELYSKDEISSINKAFTKDASSIRSLMFSIAYELGPNEGFLGKFTPSAVRGRVGKLFTKLSDEAGLGLFKGEENPVRNQLTTNIDEKTPRGQTNVIGGERHPHYDKRGGFSKLKTDIDNFLQGDGGTGNGTGGFVQVQNFDIDPGEAMKPIFLHEGTNDVYVMEETSDGNPAYALYGKLYQQEGFRAIRVKDWDDSSPDKVINGAGKELGEIKEWQGVGEVITSSNNENLGYEIIEGDKVVPVMKYGDGYISFSWMIEPDDKVQAFNIDNKNYVRVKDELYEVTRDGPVSNESIVRGVEFFDADSDLGKKAGNKDVAYLTSGNRIVDTDGQEINSIELTYIAEDGAVFILCKDELYDGNGKKISDVVSLQSPNEGQFIVKYGVKSFFHVDPKGDNKVDVLTHENLEEYGVKYDSVSNTLSLLESEATEEPDTPVPPTATITPTLEPSNTPNPSVTPAPTDVPPVDVPTVTPFPGATQHFVTAEPEMPENPIDYNNDGNPDFVRMTDSKGNEVTLYVHTTESISTPIVTLEGKNYSVLPLEGIKHYYELNDTDQVLVVTKPGAAREIYINGTKSGYEVVFTQKGVGYILKGANGEFIGRIVRLGSVNAEDLDITTELKDGHQYLTIEGQKFFIDDQQRLMPVIEDDSVEINAPEAEETEEPLEPGEGIEIPANAVDLNNDGTKDAIRLPTGAEVFLQSDGADSKPYVMVDGEKLSVASYNGSDPEVKFLALKDSDQLVILDQTDRENEIYINGNLRGYSVFFQQESGTYEQILIIKRNGGDVYDVYQIGGGEVSDIADVEFKLNPSSGKQEIEIEGVRFSLEGNKGLQRVEVDQVPQPEPDAPESKEEYFEDLDEAKVLDDDQERSLGLGLDITKEHIAIPSEEFSEDYILELDKNRKIAAIIDLDGNRIPSGTPKFRKIVEDIRIEVGAQVVTSGEDAIVLADFQPILKETIPPDYLKKDVIVQEEVPAVTTPDWQDAAKLWTLEGGRNERSAALGVAEEVYKEMISLSPSEVDEFKIKYALPAGYELPIDQRDRVDASLAIAKRVIQGPHYPQIVSGELTSSTKMINEWEGYNRNLGSTNPNANPYKGAVDYIIDGINNTTTTPGTPAIYANRLPEIAEDFGLTNAKDIDTLQELEDAFKTDSRYQNMTPEDFEAMMRHYLKTGEIETHWEGTEGTAEGFFNKSEELIEKVIEGVKDNSLLGLLCLAGLGVVAASNVIAYAVGRGRRGPAPTYVQPTTAAPPPPTRVTPPANGGTAANAATTQVGTGGNVPTQAAATTQTQPGIVPQQPAAPGVDANRLAQQFAEMQRQMNENQAQMYRRMTAYQVQLTRQILGAQPDINAAISAAVNPIQRLVNDVLSTFQTQMNVMQQMMQNQVTPTQPVSQPIDPAIVSAFEDVKAGIKDQNLILVPLLEGVNNLPQTLLQGIKELVEAGDARTNEGIQGVTEDFNKTLEQLQLANQHHVEYIEAQMEIERNESKAHIAQIMELMRERAEKAEKRADILEARLQQMEESGRRVDDATGNDSIESAAGAVAAVNAIRAAYFDTNGDLTPSTVVKTQDDANRWGAYRRDYLATCSKSGRKYNVEDLRRSKAYASLKLQKNDLTIKEIKEKDLNDLIIEVRHYYPEYSI
jgi:hypothetical protein